MRAIKWIALLIPVLLLTGTCVLLGSTPPDWPAHTAGGHPVDVRVLGYDRGRQASISGASTSLDELRRIEGGPRPPGPPAWPQIAPPPGSLLVAAYIRPGARLSAELVAPARLVLYDVVSEGYEIHLGPHVVGVMVLPALPLIAVPIAELPQGPLRVELQDWTVHWFSTDVAGALPPTTVVVPAH